MSANLNKVLIIGNLTRDPELRYTPKGTAVATISLAVNDRYKSGEEWKEETTFIDVDLFGKTAENVAQYQKKGSSIFVEGRMKLDTWDDKDSGQKRSKLKVAANNVQFLGGGKEKAEEYPKPRRESVPTASVKPPPIDDSDDVPF